MTKARSSPSPWINHDKKMKRRCLKCQRDFVSNDNANRICGTCKADNAVAFRCADKRHIEFGRRG